MKKLLLLAVIAGFGFNVNAQDISFGATAGLTNLNAQVTGADDESETGFHIGAFAEFTISEKFHVQPELVYSNAGDINFFSLNAIAKYYVIDALSIQAGPTFGLAGGDDIDLAEDFFGDDFTKFNLGLAFGAGYDITENIFAQARYGFQLNDHFTGDGDGEIKINNFMIGVGYRF